MTGGVNLPLRGASWWRIGFKFHVNLCGSRFFFGWQLWTSWPKSNEATHISQPNSKTTSFDWWFIPTSPSKHLRLLKCWKQVTRERCVVDKSKFPWSLGKQRPFATVEMGGFWVGLSRRFPSSSLNIRWLGVHSYGSPSSPTFLKWGHYSFSEQSNQSLQYFFFWSFWIHLRIFHSNPLDADSPQKNRRFMAAIAFLHLP